MTKIKITDSLLDLIHYELYHLANQDAILTAIRELRDRATKAEAMLEKAIEYLTLFRYTNEYYIEDQDRKDATAFLERYRKEFGDKE